MEKQLPYNIEAEQAVLGSIIIDPTAIDRIVDIINADDFYRDIHRTIYKAIETLAQKNESADIVTLSAELDRVGKLDEVGGSSYIVSLVNRVPTSANITYYAGIVARTAISRRLVHAAGLIAAFGYEQAENGLDEAEKLIFDIGQKSQTGDFSTAGMIVDDVLSDLFALRDHEREVVGVPTGFNDIDLLLGGLQRSDLLILAARPAMGKSSLALSIAYNAALDNNSQVAFFSLEMSKAQLIQRLLSYETRIPLFRLRNGRIEHNEWEKLVDARERLNTNRLHIDDTGGITLSALRSKARRLMAKNGLDLIIVDYLQLMHSPSDKNRNRSREQEIAEISSGLKELAKELNVPVLALAQLSRAVESRQSKIPMLSDLRESGSLEQDADVVMFIYRDDYYAAVSDNGQSLSDRPGVADIVIAKHRNGPIGSVPLRFSADETRFENL